MPTLQFKGKNTIWNHHLSVPYHTLEEVKELHYQPRKGEENLIIEGDNLTSLKALLPRYSGKIDCIYIDPPYNIGNEGWVYNDNVNSPMIKEWIGKVVGIDDLTRHDKWLCMMVPRLRLLKELLSLSGAILISIDDNELHSLIQIMNELFGEENYIATFTWKRRASSAMADDLISRDHEYVVVYQNGNFGGFNGIKKDYKAYSNPDNDPNGDWTLGDLTVGMTKNERPNQFYDLVDPQTNIVYSPNPSRVWAFTPQSMKTEIEEGRVVFPKDPSNKPMVKRYKKNLKDDVNPISTIIRNINNDIEPEEQIYSMTTGVNAEGTKTIQGLFGEKAFNYPKPVSLLKNLIQQTTSYDSLILDSFAGSGTTMHAVMDLNKEDGGNRQCILVQMKEENPDEPDKNICKDITRERVKRAINKYDYESGFKYLLVGKAIDADRMLEGELPDYKDFAKYVYYLCTGENVSDARKIKKSDYFVGEYGDAVIYLIYDENFAKLTKLALTLEFAESIVSRHPNKRIICYAPACFIDQEYLIEKQIEFVSIPYNLFQRSE